MNSGKSQNRISAKKTKVSLPRIRQGDIFQDVAVLENVSIDKNILRKEEILFPFIVCLNQECDLANDFQNEKREKDTSLLHLAIAPAFLLDQFISGQHWGSIFTTGEPWNPRKSKYDLLVSNEIPRFHYLEFPEETLPKLIIDFKHFFTVSRSFLYSMLDNRMCSVDDLFREKISQRFAYYISRIGLPEG